MLGTEGTARPAFLVQGVLFRKVVYFASSWGRTCEAAAPLIGLLQLAGFIS